MPSNQLELALWLEADRMRSLQVNQENLDNQREVVKEEKRLRVDNQPFAYARGILLYELAYDNFANAHSVIGSMEDLDAATLERRAAILPHLLRPQQCRARHRWRLRRDTGSRVGAQTFR
jgi:zinc protease